jgi:hypothetical protein
VHTRHGVVGVGHRHDPATRRDLRAGQTERITTTVESFVVVGDGICPSFEPGRQWRDQSGSLERVPANRLEVVIRGSGFAENVGMNRQLADIMKERPPPQAGAISVGQLKLLADQISEGPDTVSVSASPVVVSIDSGGHHQELFGCRDGIVTDVLDRDFVIPSTESLGRP